MGPFQDMADAVAAQAMAATSKDRRYLRAAIKVLMTLARCPECGFLQEVQPHGCCERCGGVLVQP